MSALDDLESYIRRAYGESPTAIASGLSVGGGQARVDPKLFLSLIQQESSGDQSAVSSAGARGLTQLMPGTASDLKVDSSTPFGNLYGGAKYLSQLLGSGLTTFDALRAYNQGPTGATKNPTAGAGYAADILRRAGMTDQIPASAKDATQAHDKAAPSGLTKLWEGLKTGAANAFVWLLVCLLIGLGGYALIMGPAKLGGPA